MNHIEFNLNINNVRYITSTKFTDWRHKGESSSIMTTIMLADYNFGTSHSALKDLETKWVKIQDLSNYYGVRTKIAPEYRDIVTNYKNRDIPIFQYVTNLINKIYNENLISNIGERLEEVTNITYTNE